MRRNRKSDRGVGREASPFLLLMLLLLPAAAGRRETTMPSVRGSAAI